MESQETQHQEALAFRAQTKSRDGSAATCVMTLQTPLMLTSISELAAVENVIPLEICARF